MQRSTFVLLACCGALTSVTLAQAHYYNFFPEDPLSIEQHLSRIGDHPSREVAFAFPPMSDFHGIVERPLFNPSRRPIRNHPMDAYRMHGVLRFGDRHVAIVELHSDGSIIRLHQGDIVDGWLVAQIGSDSIGFTNSNERYVMYIRAESNDGPNYQDDKLDEELDESGADEDRDGEAGQDTRDSYRFTDNQRQTASPFPDGHYEVAVPTEPPPPPLPPRRRPRGSVLATPELPKAEPTLR